jgi:maltose/moltooligosaccharide transporter
MLASVVWTVFRTKEYEPETYRQYKQVTQEVEPTQADNQPKLSFVERSKGLLKVVGSMPKVMKQLALVQFFSWSSMFLMWVYIFAAVVQTAWGIDPQWFDPDYIKSVGQVPAEITAARGAAGDWIGILYAAMYISAALFSTVMGKMANAIGRKPTYALGLFAGGIGFLTMGLFTNPEIVHLDLLITEVSVPMGAVGMLLPMLGIGIAWAALIAMPYTILAGAVPANKTGIYMGIFNFSVAGPQIVCGLVAGPMLFYWFNNYAINMMWLAGGALVLGAMSVYFVKDSQETAQERDYSKGNSVKTA